MMWIALSGVVVAVTGGVRMAKRVRRLALGSVSDSWLAHYRLTQ